MSAVDITISGVLYDKTARTTRPVVLIGEATLTGLGVGGGPVVPPPDSGAHPEHPIYNPPSVWPSPGHPAHPIVLPPEEPVDPPTEPPTNPADPQWVWGYNPDHGWLPVFVPGPTDPQPHK